MPEAPHRLFYVKHPLDEVLVQALPPGSLFVVGGRVRDEIRTEGRFQPQDLDYVVTGLTYEELRAALEPVGRVDLVGASFAVIKFSRGEWRADIALPRRESSSGPGHRDFAVAGGADVPLESDLGRRDFRFNMLARALPSLEVRDPYGGTADIAAGRIDVVNERAFEEDPLRILRAAQFAARFAYRPTARVSAAMKTAAHLVPTVSAERVADELTKMLVVAERPSIGLELLREAGVLEHLWPELLEGVGVEQNEWHAYDVYEHGLRTLDASTRSRALERLAALLHDVGKPRTKDGPHFYRHEKVGAELARDMLARFRFPGDLVRSVGHLVAQHMYRADPELSPPALRRFIRRVGVEHLAALFALRAADIAGSGLPKRDDSNERFEARVWEEIARKPPFSVADLAIGGQAVVDELVVRGAAPPGFRGDRRVGEALRYLFEQVTDRPDRNEPDELNALLRAYLERDVSRETTW